MLKHLRFGTVQFCSFLRSRAAAMYFVGNAMSPVSEQMALPGSRTNSELLAARFLVKPGRKYEDAVK